MKISILLPSRDRLEYLRYAVMSVLREEAEDWEIVISDNQSTSDVAGYVASLGDERIRYIRTDRVLPVAENWNNALNRSTGEYVLMLGDDDAVLPGYFATVRRDIERFEQPDLIYHNALLFTYPDVDPSDPTGHLQTYGYAAFLEHAEQPFRLASAEAHKLVRDAMRFRIRYGFNMQFATFSRTAADRLRRAGELFHSPFPDYYAMNAFFLTAASIVVEPRPCVLIGVTPKSYGFFHLNTRESEGRAMLEGDRNPRSQHQRERPLLPGTNINTGWLLAMEELSAKVSGVSDLRPSYSRYRLLQIIDVYGGYYLSGTVSREELDELRGHLRPIGRLVLDVAAGLTRTAARLVPPRGRRAGRALLRRALQQFPPYVPRRDPRHFNTALDVLDGVDPDI